MHSACVESQLLVSVLLIAVPTNAENFKFFPTLACVPFSSQLHNRIVIHAQ